LKGHNRHPNQQKPVSQPIRPKKPKLNPAPSPEPPPPPINAEEETEGKMANNSTTTIRNFSQTGPLNNPGKPKPITVPEVMEAVREAKPKYADNPKPTYPRMARRKGYQGTVWLRVLVLANGQVSKVEIAKSSGYQILDHTALKTVKEWRFYPAMKGDMPVTSWVKIPIIFRLLSY
jgi:protein TonB